MLIKWNLFLGGGSLNVHNQVEIRNQSTANVFSNLAPNKFVTFDDKEPPWVN